MTAAQAIHLLHLHKCQAHGIGRPPGRTARARDPEVLRESILRNIAAIERGAGLADQLGVPETGVASASAALSAGAGRD